MSQTTVADRNFATFELGDIPAELAGGVLREIAQPLGIDLADGTDPASYRQLVGALGQKKTLQENLAPTDIWTPEQAAALVDRTGIQQPLNRSLWSPDIPSPADSDKAGTGGVFNWMGRVATLLESQPGSGKIWLPTGNREMKSPTEITVAWVQEFFAAKGRYPTEAEYQELVVAPQLIKAGKTVEVISYGAGNAEEIAQREISQLFVADQPELFVEGKSITFVRVANAGLQLAFQFRRAARAANSKYDQKSSPQAFVLTDGYPVARTEADLKDPGHFQNSYNALRQAAVTAVMLAEARI